MTLSWTAATNNLSSSSTVTAGPAQTQTGHPVTFTTVTLTVAGTPAPGRDCHLPALYDPVGGATDNLATVPVVDGVAT